MRRPAAAALLAMVAGCGGPQPGRTGVTFVDACLHWTACITPPASTTPCAYGECLASCTIGFGGPPHPPRLPWAGVEGIAVTTAQLDCIAAAGLDCERALDCVSAPAPVDCPTPTSTCDGDTLTRCDQFRGARIVTEDCAAEGLHCVPVGNEARCALAACDPKTFTIACIDNHIEECSPVYGADGATIGGIVVSEEDCGAHDATCTVVGTSTECVGNGPACTFVQAIGGIACDGDVLIVCDTSGHQERDDCTALGMHCVMVSPNSGSLTFDCASLPGVDTCVRRPTFDQCDGTTLQYCDDKGNAVLDCKSLGYSGCADGHCVP